MAADKSLIVNTCLPAGMASQIYRHRPESIRDEPQNLLHLDNQAFTLTFCEHS